jgi:hypothetical protein
VGLDFAEIQHSFATGKIAGPGAGWSGGLVGFESGTIDGCYAAGAVVVGNNTGNNNPRASAGGLVGAINSPATIENAYSTGSVAGGQDAAVGGLIGYSAEGTITDSYSTGAPVGGAGSVVGGFIGEDNGKNGFNDVYWDTDTSGMSQGAGNIPNDPGITGLTTAQLQSGLPAGFDPKIWAENPNINNGLPYLIADPPPK